MEVTVKHPVRDEGTIVLFQVEDDENGGSYLIAVDHRCAAEIMHALREGEDVRAYVEGWQIVGRA